MFVDLPGLTRAACQLNLLLWKQCKSTTKIGGPLAIFLHFFNREAYRAANFDYSLPRLEFALRVLAIARSDPFFTNFANILESGIVSSHLVAGLLRQRQILVEGERPSLVEFVESRAERYAFDSSRYPMYFGRDPSPIATIHPELIRTTSLTDHLEESILAVAAHKRGFEDIGARPRDVGVMSKLLPRITDSIRAREGRGITQSLFADSLKSTAELSATARLLSSIYISRHQHDLHADIATGLQGLAIFDHLAIDPWLANVDLLYLIVKMLGFRASFDPHHDSLDQYIVDLRASHAQTKFSNAVRDICGALARCHQGRVFGGERDAVNRRLHLAQDSTYRQLAPGPNLYDAALINAQQAISVLRSKDLLFAKSFEEEAMYQGRRSLLLVTATKVETQALYDVLKELLVLTPTFVTLRTYVAADFGEYRSTRVIHVQCEAGSVGPSGSQIVIGDAIRDFRPESIVMGGIAFGIDRSKQTLGDVLISKMLVEYERAKIKSDTEIPRGQRIEPSPKLLSIFRAADARNLMPEAALHFGTILSGEKLVDSAEFLKSRLEHEPEAIGGEMEGAGLAAVAKREEVPWIVVKAIVDWASDKEAQNTEQHQRAMARNAFLLIVRALDTFGL